MNKYIYKYYYGKPIPYESIVEIRPWSQRKNQGLEIITNEINGSYYLALADADQSTIDLLIAFLYRCRVYGFDQAVSNDVNGVYAALLNYAEAARKGRIPFAVVLLAVGVFAGKFWNLFVGWMLLLFSATPARQSGKKPLYLVSVVLSILAFVILIKNGL